MAADQRTVPAPRNRTPSLNKLTRSTRCAGDGSSAMRAEVILFFLLFAKSDRTRLFQFFNLGDESRMLNPSFRLMVPNLERCSLTINA